MKISAVIPTKNRYSDLSAAVKSILRQTRKPDQLVIIDQSGNLGGSDEIITEIQTVPEIELAYVYDPSIQGLVAAKAESLNHLSGDIVCFLEDDVVLEQEYIGAIEQGFLRKPSMLGCCGVVTNPPKIGELYLFFYELFHRWIFEDRRARVYASITADSQELIPSDALSGGLSAWRREVFDQVSFDVASGFHMLEDFEFSKRASEFFGERFYINPKARLEHNFSPVNRDVLDAKQKRKVMEYLMFYKKHRLSPHALSALLWLLIGLCMDATSQSLRCRTFLPLIGTFQGVWAGIAKKVASLSP